MADSEPYFAIMADDRSSQWIPLLQKAYAKFVRDYAALDLDFTFSDIPLRAMTNMPVDTEWTHYTWTTLGPDELYNKIATAAQKEYVMFARCATFGYGLSIGESYLIAGVNEETQRIIMLNLSTEE